MSDEPRTQRQSQPGDREPSEERRSELRAAYAANMAAGDAPYTRVRIGTRSELA